MCSFHPFTRRLSKETKICIVDFLLVRALVLCSNVRSFYLPFCPFCKQCVKGLKRWRIVFNRLLYRKFDRRSDWFPYISDREHVLLTMFQFQNVYNRNGTEAITGITIFTQAVAIYHKILAYSFSFLGCIFLVLNWPGNFICNTFDHT